MINPVRHAATSTDAESYMVEPYVLAADVLAVEPHIGRGGWTWYTGSAGWMYRLISESMLGLKRRGATLVIEPNLPDTWDSLEIDYIHGEGTYRIRFSRDFAAGIECDGVRQDGSAILLSPAQAVHEVHVGLADRDSTS
jgi:cellobiose phosphorylase